MQAAKKQTRHEIISMLLEDVRATQAVYNHRVGILARHLGVSTESLDGTDFKEETVASLLAAYADEEI